MKNPFPRSSWSALAFVSLVSTPASAAVLAQYGFNNSSSPGDVSSPASGLTASSATLTYSTSSSQTGGGTSGLNPIEGTRSVFTFGASISNTAAPAVSDHVVNFNLTPDVGQAITLDLSNAVTWQFLSYDGSINSTPYTVYTKMIVASDSAFNNVLAQSSVFSATNSGTGNDNSRWGPVTNGSLNSTVSSSSTLYFRLVGSDDLSSGDQQLRFDNIVVNGTVAPIPEPSIALLGGLGLFGLLRRRR